MSITVGKHGCRSFKWLGARHPHSGSREVGACAQITVQTSSLGVSYPNLETPSRACPEVCLLSETRSVRLIVTMGPHKMLTRNLRKLCPSEISLFTTFLLWLTRREMFCLSVVPRPCACSFPPTLNRCG